MLSKMKNLFIKSLTPFFVLLLIVSCGHKTVKNEAASEKGDSIEDIKLINMDSIQLFLQYDQTEAIKVNENITRKFMYLNGIMTVIVDFYNGPMLQPDPFHSEGEVLVIIGDQQQKLKAGDMFIVPSNVPHTVQSLTERLRLVDSFNPIRKDFIKK